MFRRKDQLVIPSDATIKEVAERAVWSSYKEQDSHATVRYYVKGVTLVCPVAGGRIMVHTPGGVVPANVTVGTFGRRDRTSSLADSWRDYDAVDVAYCTDSES